MRRFFAVPTSRSVLAAVAFSRWQSEAAASGEEAGSKADQKSDAKDSKAAANPELEKLQKAIEANKSAIGEVKKQILYAAANAENSRREFREAADREKLKGQNAFAKDLLETADALEQVCKTIGTYREEKPELPAKTASLLSGVDLSLKVVLKSLNRYGVSRMDIKAGDAFDPATMKSIMTTPATETVKSGQVSEVVKAGYLRNGETLRVAEVGIAESP